MKTFFLLSFLIITSKAFTQKLLSREIHKCVAFMFEEDAAKNLHPWATGFYVSVRKPGTKYQALYLATARHVVEPQKGIFKTELVIRATRKSDSVLVVNVLPLIYTGPKKNVFFHTDSTADAVIITSLPKADKYDFQYLDEEMFITKADYDSMKVSEGSEVFFTGMFTQYVGEKENHPITRFGRVSLVTNERVFWNGAFRNLFLVEASTYWGNSGSPVYFTHGKYDAQTDMIKLGGIMCGFFGDMVPGAIEKSPIIPYSQMNFGISAVTPAYFLSEILMSKELKDIRGY